MEYVSPEVDLGKNIQNVRKKRGLTIKELAKVVKISASMLSQIERAQANPSISTMKAIADALNEPLYNFFLPQTENSGSLVSRAATRQKYSFSPKDVGGSFVQQRPAGYECERLSSTPGKLEMLRIKLPKKCSSNTVPRFHSDEEIAFVESGTVKVQLGTQAEVLHQYDSISIPAGTPHFWINESEEDVYLILSLAKFNE